MVQQRDKIIMRIEDNGQGFDMGLENRGNGLNNMRLRSKEIKGIFSIDSNPGKGSTITLIF
jgi:signal transduction histidine kinase